LPTREVEVLFWVKVRGKIIKEAWALFFSYVLALFSWFLFSCVVILALLFSHWLCFFFFSFSWLCSSHVVILVLLFLRSHYYILVKMRKHNNMNNTTNHKPFPHWCRYLFALVLLPSHINGDVAFPCWCWWCLPALVLLPSHIGIIVCLHWWCCLPMVVLLHCHIGLVVLHMFCYYSSHIGDVFFVLVLLLFSRWCLMLKYLLAQPLLLLFSHWCCSCFLG
jgi:hypothetical protein